MTRIARGALLAILLVAFAAFGYGAKGYLDAARDAGDLRQRADLLIAQGRGGESLGPGRVAQVLRVQDPAFLTHSGVDFTTPGAGATTISQSVSKRLAFERFRPGLGKIRQTGYALGLERHLTKGQILALWLDTLEMGRGPQGWMTGFHTASMAIYERPPADLSQAEFLRLMAVVIAPASFDLSKNDPALADRAARLQRLITDQCAPTDHGDVWLQQCG